MRFLSESILHIKIYRKDTVIIPAREVIRKESVFLSIARKASMTIEAAVVLPVFLFAMLAVLQFANVQIASSALLAGMQDTVKEVAAYAYIQEMGITAGEGIGADLLAGGITAAYAKSQVIKKSGVTSEIGSVSLWQSSFLKNDIVDLAITYQPKHAFTILPVKKIKTGLRARVRAWTGRYGSSLSSEGEDADQKNEERVYVAATGTVYHRDENCTHINLSIKRLSRSEAQNKRNRSGGKYHACEVCGGGNGANVYVTTYGDRYHSSLNCSGLKRTIASVPISEAHGLRPCSKCGKE